MQLKWKYPNNIIFPGVQLRPYMVDLIKNNHVLIAGRTGAGKSVLLNNIIYNTLLCNAPGESVNGNTANFVFIDPKRVELRKYKTLPHCIGYADNIQDIISLLRGVRAEIDNRFSRMIKQKIVTSTETPIYVFIDEIVTLLQDKKYKNTILEILADILSISRAARVFMIISTQNPARGCIPACIQINCNCKVALKVNNKIESREIIGESGAENLPPHGIGYVVKDISRYKIEIPLINNADIMQLINFWEKQHPIINFFRNLKS